jgi:hypothetical protein
LNVAAATFTGAAAAKIAAASVAQYQLLERLKIVWVKIYNNQNYCSSSTHLENCSSAK